MMETFAARLGLRWPIIQAPMAGVQDAELCIAVSEAGGLGSLPCAMLTPGLLSQQVARIRSATSNAFNLNFFCHPMPLVTQAELERWAGCFASDYARWGIDPKAALAGKVRTPFDAAFAEVLQEIKPAVVSFHFGLPEERLLQKVRDTGALILSSATTLDEALWLQACGADAIILQGREAGGHRGMFLTSDLATQRSTVDLLAATQDRLTAPIVVAGGIASAGQVKQYIDQGVAAVQIGTAYLLCDEAKTSTLHRAAIAKSEQPDTVMTNLFSGRPARGIVNRMIETLGPIQAQLPAFPYASLASAPLRAAAEAKGCDDYTPLWCGTNTQGCAEISAAALTRALAAQLE